MYDGIIGAVSFADVAIAIVAIQALVAAVFVVSKGAKFLLSMLGRDRVDGWDASKVEVVGRGTEGVTIYPNGR